tara:strand:+ start:13 stop:648 length:636 start_codon:yes stop_codon:yes gene_type:complete
MYFIFFNVLKVNQPDHSSIETADFTSLLNNIEAEYNKIVELTLANVSLTSGANPNNALDANLSYFDNFTINLTAQKHISADITSGRVTANVSYMNASVNITLKGVNSQITTEFFAVSELSVAITQIVTCTAGPNALNYRVTVLKEYGEPVLDLVAGDFKHEYDGGAISPSLANEGNGVYLFTSSTACAGGNTVYTNATDKRKVFEEGSEST